MTALQSKVVVLERTGCSGCYSTNAAWGSARALGTTLCQVLLANFSHAKVGRAALYSRLSLSACVYGTYLTLQFKAESICWQTSCFPNSPRCVGIWQVSGGSTGQDESLAVGTWHPSQLCVKKGKDP